MLIDFLPHRIRTKPERLSMMWGGPTGHTFQDKSLGLILLVLRQRERERETERERERERENEPGRGRERRRHEI